MIITLDELLSSVPKQDDIANMGVWFADIEKWAIYNKHEDIVKNAKDAIYFYPNKQRIKDYRLKLLAQLKSLQKGSVNMDNKTKIFIVHGHDVEIKLEVARFVEKFGFEAIILHEQPNEGKTIIEKLEKHSSSACYAIVLYTADDDANGKMRARQNVVFEHGYFVAKLGRSKVCVILEDGVEKPGDIDGIVYISDKNWQFNLEQELKAADLLDKNGQAKLRKIFEQPQIRF